MGKRPQFVPNPFRQRQLGPTGRARLEMPLHRHRLRRRKIAIDQALQLVDNRFAGSIVKMR